MSAAVRHSRQAFAERVGRVQALGYSDREAEFLTATVLLGGFFLKRQFRAYFPEGSSYPVARLLHQTAGRGHLTRHVGGQRGLYRLRGPSLLRAAGYQGRRLGHHWSARTAKRHLMSLDYWIERRDKDHLLLAAVDKSAYFASLGIPPDCLPTGPRKIKGEPRYLPGACPISLPQPGEQHPLVRLPYAHSGSTGEGFSHHLASYEPLARALAQRGIGCQWEVLADSEGQFRTLWKTFKAWWARATTDSSEREYFQLRRLVEKRRWDELPRESVERYYELSAQFSGRDSEQRYLDWAKGGCPPPNPAGDLAQLCKYQEREMAYNYAAADNASL